MGINTDIWCLKKNIVDIYKALAKLKAYTLIDATYTVLVTDNIIEADGTFTVTLPTAVGIEGDRFTVKNSGTGVITIDTFETETIDGSLTASLPTQWDSLTFASNGVNYIIV